MTIALPAPEKGAILGKADFDRERASQAVAEALEVFKSALDLSEDEIAKFIHIPRATLNNWLRAGKVPVEAPNSVSPVTEAVLHLIAIHRSVSAMFSSSERQKAWLETEHPSLNEVPVNLMRRSVEGLVQVRRYLDYVRGRGA